MATPTRRTSRAKARMRGRLPGLTVDRLAVAALALYVIARTWPFATTAVTTLLVAALIVQAYRARWNILRTVSRLAGRLRFDRLTPDGFEHAIAELARQDPRITGAVVVGQANDRGADILARHIDGRRILIQCKRYAPRNTVGSDVIQTVNGTYRDIHHCHQAVIVTTSTFTRAARETNLMLPTPIALVDGAGLTAWANGGPTPWQ